MPKVVCIVDDQPSMRQMLRFALSMQGMQVLEAEHGLDALDKITETAIDMMIVDWQMPIMDGLKLVRHLRQMDEYIDLPVVMISCRNDLDARKEARSLGVMNWIKKPFRIGEIQQIVVSGLGLAAGRANQLAWKQGKGSL